MKNFILLFLAFFLLNNLYAQSLSASELLNKSIQYHDPSGNWDNFKATLHFEQCSPTRIEQSVRKAIFDRSKNYFKMVQTTGDETISREMNGDNCTNLYNGNSTFSEDISKKYRLTCDRAKMYRDYYSYLYGLPMKLKDPGTIIDPTVKADNFEGKDCYSIRVTYEKEVGEDIWYFYFDKQNYALFGYRFYHEEEKNDGEYITLYGEETIGGIRLPKNRFWYYNKDDKFLGADFLMPAEGTTPDKELTKADYERAISFRWNNLNNKEIFDLNIRPNWFPDSTGFWFEQHGPAGKKYQQFLTKDLKTTALFDHKKVTDLLNEIGKDTLKANDLSLQSLAYKNSDTLKFVFKNKHYHLSRNDHQLHEVDSPKKENPLESLSPDGKWLAYAKDYNLYIKSTETEQEYQLSTKGKKLYEYASYVGWADIMEGENGERPEKFNVNWSPDSKYLQTDICDLRYANKMYLLDWSVDTLLWKPSHFDPNKKYPIIDHSYTGPHTQMYPKSFSAGLRRNNQALAELGFIVIMVDGMGSSGRSKAFHNYSYKNMGMNLQGHVLAIELLGKRYSWLDTDRVGIFGHSAGGYDAGHAVLQFPDVYKVAVASSADHDFRMEKAWWPEMYMGWPVDSTYHQVSNITMAGNLKGKLLLVHGGIDDNVNPSATFKLAEALVDADKEFDLLILPSQRHGYRDKQHARYFIKKRWNYFVEHLLGKTPVWEFEWPE